MIGSFYKDLLPIQSDEIESSERAGEVPYPADSEDSLLASLPVVQKIVRRKSFIGWQADAADIVQAVALRLIKWRGRNHEKSEEMSPEDWHSFAARTAYNEINRQNSSKLSARDVPLEDVPEDMILQSFEGQTRAEFRSLVRGVWQGVCSLTLRQRRSLLLHNQKLLIKLMFGGITDEEIARSLEMPLGVWLELEKRLPLCNREIAEFILKQDSGSGSGNGSSKGNNLESLIRSIIKARYEARAKVRRVTDK
jgi:DNA-directed RNA polymerase specialized sigma24 family protein